MVLQIGSFCSFSSCSTSRAIRGGMQMVTSPPLQGGRLQNGHHRPQGLAQQAQLWAHELLASCLAILDVLAQRLAQLFGALQARAKAA